MADIFVFGSNLAGRHGKGAALAAVKHHGAIRGRGIGIQGNSYAIPTKNENIRTLPLAEIREHVNEFKRFAAFHPEMTFKLTPIGCGLAGYAPADIAPMFNGAPANVVMPPEFELFLALVSFETADIVTSKDGTQGPSIEHKFWMLV